MPEPTPTDRRPALAEAHTPCRRGDEILARAYGVVRRARVLQVGKQSVRVAVAIPSSHTVHVFRTGIHDFHGCSVGPAPAPSVDEGDLAYAAQLAAVDHGRFRRSIEAASSAIARGAVLDGKDWSEWFSKATEAANAHRRHHAKLVALGGKCWRCTDSKLSLKDPPIDHLRRRVERKRDSLAANADCGLHQTGAAYREMADRCDAWLAEPRS